MSDDLTAFLLARIAEDEQIAREARQYSPPPWTAVDSPISGGMVCCDHDPMHSDPEEADTYVAGCEHRHDADFIARWDPARVLAECEAKRRLLAIHRPDPMWPKQCEGCGTEGECGDWPITEDINQCPVLRSIALPYATHPDYRAEWAPEADQRA